MLLSLTYILKNNWSLKVLLITESAPAYFLKLEDELLEELKFI